MTHCSMRVAMNDMAYSTMRGCEKILDALWRPAVGDEEFEGIVYSRLAEIAAADTTKMRTYNNVVSALRCAFDFGYKDHPEKHNPASGLTTFRIQKKDRPPVDPFTIQEGELIIAASHEEFGLPHGNYEESRFLTGLRQSEQIAGVDSCVSWRLMAGHNVMLAAEEDGHSVATMLKTYAAWTKGATAADVEIIKRAMECAPLPPSLAPSQALRISAESMEFVSPRNLPPNCHHGMVRGG